jgi:hypothetical protein
MYSSTLSLTSVLDGGWVINVTSRPLYRRERLGTHCVGGWTGTRAGLDEFDPRTVQPVAIRHTDWAIPARWAIILVINGVECLWNTTSWVPTLHAWKDSQRYVLFQTRKHQTTWITKPCVVSDICEAIRVRMTTNYKGRIFCIPRLDMICKQSKLQMWRIILVHLPS